MVRHLGILANGKITIDEQGVPNMSERSKARAARDERLQAALRENLRRRKAQAQARQEAPRQDDEKADSDQSES
jgi:hypothetical protein